jgi:hypothetical protein
MADYFDIDPVLVRVAWVVLCFATAGVALAVYVVMAMVMPRHGSSDSELMEVVSENLEGLTEDASEFAHRLRWRRDRTRTWLAVGLIAIGTLVLLSNLGIFSLFHFDAWPIVLIVVGGAILIGRVRK